ncbi:MAG TPA: hypothetical protein H9691_06705 [Firmicutes bacterium]|nr:hypothetical protein [Bacillota bacterium]
MKPNRSHRIFKCSGFLAKLASHLSFIRLVAALFPGFPLFSFLFFSFLLEQKKISVFGQNRDLVDQENWA